MNETFLQNIISNNNLSILHELCISPLLYLDKERLKIQFFKSIPKLSNSKTIRISIKGKRTTRLNGKELLYKYRIEKRNN